MLGPVDGMPGDGMAAGCIAIGDGQGRWVLVNAGPDLGSRLGRLPPGGLPVGRPAAGLRHVVLMDARIDHVAGLLSLRDGPPLHLHATPAVFEALGSRLPVLPVLEPTCGVRWHLLPVAGDTLEAEFQVDVLPWLRFIAVSIDDTVPDAAHAGPAPAVGDLIALYVEDLLSGGSVFVSPALPSLGAREQAWMARAGCVLVDGTPFGAGARRRTDLPGTTLPPGAAMAWLEQLRSPRKVLFRGTSASTRTASGIEWAHDGMEIEL